MDSITKEVDLLYQDSENDLSDVDPILKNSRRNKIALNLFKALTIIRSADTARVTKRRD